MFNFILAWIGGVTLRFLLAWAFSSGLFNFKSNLAQIVAAVAVGIGLAWLFKSINVSSWLGYAVVAACGFLSKYGLEWLNKKSGNKTASNFYSGSKSSVFLLGITDFGKNGYGLLWIIYALLSIWFIYQSVKAVHDPISSYYKKPLYKVPVFGFFIAITVIAVIIHFCIAASYK
jgi:hypothetical protein